MAKEKIKIKLQGHEKFALREGWLSKGLLAVSDDSTVFQNKYAADIFGIGSNMVKSLRYWMKAFGLMEEKPGNGAKLTGFGELVLKYDPYIENPFTLWIMHSNIVRSIENATTWHMYFNYCESDNIDKEQIEKMLYREISKYAVGVNFSEKSLENDIDVLLNMYSRNKDKSDPEDKNISPFSCLKLISNSEGKYSKKHPDHKLFNEMIVLYELSNLIGERESISIEDAVFSTNGLSNIYNLSGIEANEFLDKLDASGYLRVDRTAGLDMIYPIVNLIPETIIEKYYAACV